MKTYNRASEQEEDVTDASQKTEIKGKSGRYITERQHYQKKVSDGTGLRRIQQEQFVQFTYIMVS